MPHLLWIIFVVKAYQTVLETIVINKLTKVEALKHLGCAPGNRDTDADVAQRTRQRGQVLCDKRVTIKVARYSNLRGILTISWWKKGSQLKPVRIGKNPNYTKTANISDNLFPTFNCLLEEYVFKIKGTICKVLFYVPFPAVHDVDGWQVVRII